MRTLDNHESWRGVYALLHVEPGIDTTTARDDDQRELSIDDTAATTLEAHS